MRTEIIKGYGSKYFDYCITNSGNIFKLMKDGNVKPVKSFIKKGFQYVNLGLINESKTVTKFIHRLVAEYFIPKNDNGNKVKHRDGNKKNNNWENLEWFKGLNIKRN